MEKTLSPDERIKRAEEIYYRKKIQASNGKTTRVSVSDRKNNTMIKKMILQIIICILIYTICYMIKNTNYIFSEDVLSKIHQVLSYDLNIENLYKQGMEYVNSIIHKPEEEESQNIQEKINNENTTIEAEQVQNIENNNQNEVINENNGIGGENVQIENIKETNLTQMEQDAKDILQNISLTIPLRGTITSRYGERDSNNPIVSKFHTGIDIAVNQGTVFVAAMAGKVKKVSSEGAYRKSCRNRSRRCNNNICTLQSNIC